MKVTIKQRGSTVFKKYDIVIKVENVSEHEALMEFLDDCEIASCLSVYNMAELLEEKFNDIVKLMDGSQRTEKKE